MGWMKMKEKTITGWDATAEKQRKLICDADGKLIVKLEA